MNPFYTNVLHAGNHVLFRGIDGNGKRIKTRVPYKPTYYTPAQAGSDTKFKTLFNERLDAIEFDSIISAKEFTDQYKNVPNFKIYGNIRHDYAFISDTFRGDIDWDLTKIVLAYIDIEVGSDEGFPKPDQAHHPVTAITIHVGGKFWVFGCGDFQTDREDVQYKKCVDEKELLRSFVQTWVQHMPDICTGWNTNEFDFPYLINRMERLFMGKDGEDIVKTMSPWTWIKAREKTVFNNTVNFYDIVGVSLVDYLDLYKKYSNTPQESYKLDFIGSTEVGTQKINYDEYDSLYTLYKRDFQKFIEYNIRDVEIVMKIEDKLRLMELAMTLAYDSKVNFEDVLSQGRMWDSIIYNYLKKKNIIVPPKPNSSKKVQFVGAYVKESKPGMYHWLASFDFKSLYPHLIMMFNLSTETIVEPVDYPEELENFLIDQMKHISIDGMLKMEMDTSILKKYNMTLTPNCQLFRTDKKGFLPELMEEMYKDRDKYKKLMSQATKKLQASDLSPVDKSDLEKQVARYNNLQMAKKVCLNSAYGSIGNQYFRFFDVRIAEAITTSAQLSVLWIQKRLNEYMNLTLGTKGKDYIVASDTDSVYLELGGIVDKTIPKEKQKELGALKIIRQLDKLCEGMIQPYIDKSCEILKDYTNAFEQKLEMKREALADKAIWTGKKHYIINIYNNEGIEYAKPKLKIVGMEAIKSSSPQICRTKMKEAYGLAINKGELDLRKLVDTFRKEFLELPVQDIAFPRGMNGLEKYTDAKTIYGFKTPAHTKGALLFNHHLKRMNLLDKYEEIKEGEKLKYVYLKAPNPLQCDVISFVTIIPKEFELEKYLDYNVMYEKSFIDPITTITNAIGWRLEDTGSLEDLFGD